MSKFNYQRRNSSIVQIGDTPLGGKHPIRIQSMANTSTLDTQGCVEQALRIVAAGAAYVRFTAQGEREATNLKYIREDLHKAGVTTPLVADIHFNPRAADVAATTVEKVRINPGNFVDSARTFKQLEYTPEEYSAELERLRARFVSFLDICKAHHTAIRIGVNHGSLSDRIMSQYGDTPEGMVESCLEFLRVCQAENFPHVVISIKSSNTVVMVQTVRLLIAHMERENLHFPLHLGVTEAGDGEDGRIKSAVGIGALLADGIGDTIRVSLSEAPELEVPVAQKLVQYITARTGHAVIEGEIAPNYNPTEINHRQTYAVGNIGGNNAPIVISYGNYNEPNSAQPRPDYIYLPQGGVATDGTIPTILPLEHYTAATGQYPCFGVEQLEQLTASEAAIKFLVIDRSELTDNVVELLKNDSRVVLIAHSTHQNPVGELKALFHQLLTVECTTPVVIVQSYEVNDRESLQIVAGADYGALLLDGFGDGILLNGGTEIETATANQYAFAILQAARLRVTKTEYISCPSCGRTLFDIEKTIAEVKAATAHLKGLKIGIMGCIVNGPGEMADADFGYVGAGRGKVSLYRNKECVEKNIPQEEAIERLIALIKQEGKWIDVEINESSKN